MRTLKANVTDDAFEIWQEMLEAEHITFAALIQAIAEYARFREDLPEVRFDAGQMHEVLVRAREVQLAPQPGGASRGRGPRAARVSSPERTQGGEPCGPGEPTLAIYPSSDSPNCVQISGYLP